MLATYSHFFYSKKCLPLKIIFLPFCLLRFIVNTQLLSRKIVDVFNTFECDFIQSFAFLLNSKVCHVFRYLTETKIEVDKEILIEMKNLQIFSKKYKKFVDISVPASDDSIKCQLYDQKSAREEVI